MEYDIKLNKELYSYAVALTQLYGIYTVEFFIEVWNLHHEDPEYFLDFEEASMYFYMMYDRQDYFNYDYQYVVANYPRGKDLYKLLAKRNNFIKALKEEERWMEEMDRRRKVVNEALGIPPNKFIHKYSFFQKLKLRMLGLYDKGICG